MEKKSTMHRLYKYENENKFQQNIHDKNNKTTTYKLNLTLNK